MSTLNPNVQDQLDRLTGEVSALRARVDELALLVGERAVAPGTGVGELSRLTGGPARLGAVDGEEPPDTGPDFSQITPGRLSAPAILTALAVVCFLMVVALILRTLTDGKIVNQQFGTALGIGYASLLVVYGWHGHGRGKPRAPIFIVSGALLLFSVVLEAHIRFQALSTPVAFVTLGVALAAMTVLGMRARCALLICLGILGSAFAGLALDFPDPQYPTLAIFLFLANGAAYRSRHVARCLWVRWPMLMLTAFFWFLWAVKAHAALRGIHGLSIAPALPWVLPGLVLFMAGSLAVVVAAALQEAAAVSVYEIFLPPLAAAGTVAISVIVLIPYFASPVLVSAVGLGSALVPLALALGLSAKGEKGGRIVPALVVAAIVPLIVFLPGCCGSAHLVPLVCSLAAAALIMSPALGRHESVCVISHFFQALVCGMAAMNGILSVDTLSSDGALAVPVLAGSACIIHYVLSRRLTTSANGLSERSQSPAFYTEALPFAAGLVYLLGLSRMILFVALSRAGAGEDAFQAGQSLLINVCAVMTAVVGIELLCDDIVVIAVIVAVLGAGKVFVYDLTHLHGIPVVLSVLSTGITTAIGAVLWPRWQKLSGEQPRGETSR